MLKEHENYMSMVGTVDDLLVEEAGIVTAIPALQAKHNELVAKTAVVKGYQLIQETSIKGWTKRKKELKGDMIKKTMKIVSGVTAYALDKNETVLFEEVNYTKTKLEDLGDEEVDVACVLVHDKAAGLGIAVQDYGLLPADVTAQATATGLYVAVKQMPSGKADDRQVATARIKEGISDIRAIFKTMDRIVKTMADTEPDFVDKYFNAREIYDIGVRHEPVVEPPVPPVV
jgi:hypothetical protein